LAAVGRACSAGRTGATGLEDLDRDAIARLHAPRLRSQRPDPLDDTDRLVARHEREPDGQRAAPLLVVGAAEATRLDPEHRVVIADRRHREVALAQPTRRLEHERPGHQVAARTPPSRSSTAPASFTNRSTSSAAGTSSWIAPTPCPAG